MPKREPLSPTERVLRARGAAHAKHARYDAKAAMDKARVAFLARFERLADPEGGCRPPSASAAPSSCAAPTSPGSRSPPPRPAAPAARRPKEVRRPGKEAGRARLATRPALDYTSRGSTPDAGPAYRCAAAASLFPLSGHQAARRLLPQPRLGL